QATRQREALQLLAGSPAGIPTPALAARGIPADTVSRLTRSGFISIRHDRVDRDPFVVQPVNKRLVAQAFRPAVPDAEPALSGGTERGWSGDGVERGRSGDGVGTEWGRSGDGAGTEAGRDRKLTAEQANALDRLHTIADTGQFRVALLHGVTGSGKTEIYLHLTATVCRHGRTALI